jgi:hypothetical protein
MKWKSQDLNFDKLGEIFQNPVPGDKVGISDGGAGGILGNPFRLKTK